MLGVIQRLLLAKTYTDLVSTFEVKHGHGQLWSIIKGINIVWKKFLWILETNASQYKWQPVLLLVCIFTKKTRIRPWERTEQVVHDGHTNGSLPFSCPMEMWNVVKHLATTAASYQTKDTRALQHLKNNECTIHVVHYISQIYYSVKISVQ